MNQSLIWCASYALVAILIAPLGCSRTIDWSSTASITSHIEITTDPYKHTISYVGPNAATQPGDHVMLRAWMLPSGTVAYQVYIEDVHTYDIVRGGTGWRFYAAAHDTDGQRLPMTLISKDVMWCGQYTCEYREIVGIDLTRDYIEAHTTAGVKIQISGKRDEETITLPGPYIQAMLTVVQ